MKKQSLYILVTVCVLSTVMNLVDSVFLPPYFIKSMIKVSLFLLAPMVYFLLNKQDFALFKVYLTPRKQDLLLSAGLGLGFYGTIVLGYQLLKGFLDFSGITARLTEDVGVNPDNFVFVALYISLCNSFLEEFFFRGFAFVVLKGHTGRKFAYGFSSLLFAFYHVGMTLGWVEPYLFVLMLLGLIIGGLLFDFLSEKTNSLYPSWLVHMFINFGINTIGFLLFGML